MFDIKSCILHLVSLPGLIWLIFRHIAAINSAETAVLPGSGRFMGQISHPATPKCTGMSPQPRLPTLRYSRTHTKMAPQPTGTHTKMPPQPIVTHTKMPPLHIVTHAKMPPPSTVTHTKMLPQPIVTHTKMPQQPIVRHNDRKKLYLFICYLEKKM